MDDLPIVELPEHYHIDSERLGLALAHVSAQANSIAEHQVKLQHRQSLHEEEQQRFIEQRVEAAREEAEARSNALVLAIQQTYGDPSTLQHRVDARIHDVLQQLQHGAQDQARSIAEGQLAERVALHQLVEQRMQAALQHIEQEVTKRADQRIQDLCQDINKRIEDRFHLALQHAEGNARDIVQGELKGRSVAHENAFAQYEARVVALVRGILDQYDSAARKRQAQQSAEITDHVEERLRQVVIVAKSAAETKALDVVAKQVSATVLACSSTVTSTASTCTSTTDPAEKITASNKSRPRPERRLDRKKRAQADEVQEDEAGRVLRRQERRDRAKIDRIQKEAQAAVRTRAATRAAELLGQKSKVRFS